MRRLFALAALFAVTAVLAARAQAPSAFRAGIDVVQLDVSVLDRNRQPVKGLTASDFTVLEDGKPQSVVAFEEVDIPKRVIPAAAWMEDAGRDVATNDGNMRRIVIIVLDDAFMPIGDATSVAQRIARDVIDQLGESDLAAVTFTLFGRRQDVTQDRPLLRAAVDSLAPSGWFACRYRGKYRSHASCVIDTLTTVAQTLKEAPLGRKTLVFISGGIGSRIGWTTCRAQAAMRTRRRQCCIWSMRFEKLTSTCIRSTHRA